MKFLMVILVSVLVVLLVPQPLSVAWEAPERFLPGGLLTGSVVNNLEPYRERDTVGNVEEDRKSVV